MKDGQRKMKKELFKRYFVFLIGLFINSFGVSFITKANLGTSPISSIPYVLSLEFVPTLGQFTILFNILLILFQVALLGKRFKIINLLQLPATILFGCFIDLSMEILWFVDPQNYVFRVIALLIGCIILGFGVYIEVIADVVMLPGEAFVKAITQRFKTDFGITKVFFDGSMTVISVIMSFVFFRKLNGVGIGTIIAALIVGIIARYFGKILVPLTKFLFGKYKKQETEAQHASGESPVVVTIGREFGSGGRNIGKLVAEKLNIKFYDSELLNMFANETGKTVNYIKKNDQKVSSKLLFNILTQSNAYYLGEKESLETVFEGEKRVLGQLANTTSCVIVGRLANFVLSHNNRTIHIFLRADINDKIKHVMERDNLTRQQAEQKIKKVEKERKDHCRHMTGKEWGNAKYYDMCINTSLCGEEKTADIIVDLVNSCVNNS